MQYKFFFLQMYSLKVGKVHSITHDIPLNAPFRSYDDMRQHWKIMVMSILISSVNLSNK